MSKVLLKGGLSRCSNQSDSQGPDDLFEKLPNELIIFIFTKLSTTSDSYKHNTLDDIKLLGRCSSISKRFNALACLIPELSINHPYTSMLYKYCPKILNKFKHIRSLQITHQSSITAQSKRVPVITWEASYRPHSYCLAVVARKKLSAYIFEDPRSFMLSDDTPMDDEYHDSLWSHIRDMICLHHMLVSSIKDHGYLQRVVVTNLYNEGTFILEEDILAELRNCTSTNLEHVLVRDRSGSAINLDVPYPVNRVGLVMNEVCFNIIEWREKASHDPIHKVDEDVTSIPTDLRSVSLMPLLRILLKEPANVEVNDSGEILQLLSDMKSDGNLM